MSAKNSKSGKKRNRSGRRVRPVGAAPSSAQSSRVVIRDKSPINPLIVAPESLAPLEQESETSTVVSYGRHGHGVVFHPVPYVYGNPLAAHIDWLAFTVKQRIGDGIEWLFRALARVTGIRKTATRKNGWNGYTNRADLDNFGFVAWGGAHQRNTIHVEINGTGCTVVNDWSPFITWLQGERGGKITRVDLAHDDFLGKTCSIETVYDWYNANGFTNGGRRPKIRRAGDWDDLLAGRTLYIGTRGSKLLRCYEKGKQLGRTDSNWMRVELQLNSKNRDIPLDVLLVPGQYLAGAYPCLKFLSETQCKIKTTQLGAKYSLEVMTREASRLAGKAINVLMRENGGDAAVVVQKLRREGIPKRLVPYGTCLAGGRDADT